MKKPVLPRKVAEAIQYQINGEGLDLPGIVSQSFRVWQYSFHGATIRDFAADNFETFLQALVNGYEVEKTPLERVHEFLQLQIDAGRPWIADYIEEAFKLYGIEI